MQIILRAQSGDREAFAVLFEQHKNLVYKTAYFMLGEATEAEDALQESCFYDLALSRHIQLLPESSSQKATFHVATGGYFSGAQE